MERGHRVVIASSGRSLALLQQEFPQLTCVDVPAYDIQYQEKGSFIIKIIAQLGKIFTGIRREHLQAKELVKTYNIDLIISDNRYGFYHRDIPSVIITHQMMVKIPQFKLAEPFVYLWLQLQHSRFDHIWIPDVEGSVNVSGDLSHAYPLLRRARYIGILTRFHRPEQLPSTNGEVLAIISGPEPQRTLFEQILLEQAKPLDRTFTIIRGISEKHTDEQVAPNIRMISHLTADALYQLILKSDVIISRGGYSTLMDLAVLNKRCIFVPTPGQTEQEYLVKELGKKQLVVAGTQHTFQLAEALRAVEATKGFHVDSDERAFIEVLDGLLRSCERS